MLISPSFYYSIREPLGCNVLLLMSLWRGLSHAHCILPFVTAYVNYWDASFCYQCHCKEACLMPILSFLLLQHMWTTGTHRFVTNVIVKRPVSCSFSLSFYFSIRELLGCIGLPQCHYKEAYLRRFLSLFLLQHTWTTGMHRFVTNVIEKWPVSCPLSPSFYHSIREPLGCIVLLPMSL